MSKPAEAEGVKVACRVRPFNSRELEADPKCCITMTEFETEIHDLDNEGAEPKRFTYDYSLWSHDGFLTDENSYNYPDPQKPDQQRDQNYCYEKLGAQVLVNAYNGFNCSLFAQGQTGSGKSQSMVGYGSNKGIIPLASDKIFGKIDQNTDDNITFEVTVSMLEIYNEKVFDLFVDAKQRNENGLNLRQHPKLGFYVEGKSEQLVANQSQIERWSDIGQSNRTIGATKMNATSSRAHTIFGIIYREKTKVGNSTRVKESNIWLIDLAGSEKSGQTGATGQRFKEGTMINQSLSALGQVITDLSDIAMGKKPKTQVISYRVSALTKILQNALGGNSKTIMICAISPAYLNYEETMSTLRYAERAKKIMNKAVVNESAQDKLIRELKEENLKMKKMCEGGTMGMTPEELEAQEEMKAAMEENEKAMKSMETDFETKIEEMKKKLIEEEKNKMDLTVPHILNLHEDVMLDRKVYQNFNQGDIDVGRKTFVPMPEIVLNNIAIEEHHAIMKKTTNENGDEIQVIEACSNTAKDHICISGKFMNENQEENIKQLEHLDRIAFGTNSVQLFYRPGATTTLDESEIDQLQASTEIWNAQETLTKAKYAKEREEQEAQQNAQIFKLNAELEKQKLAMEEEMKKREEEMMKRMMEMKDLSEKDKQKIQEESNEKSSQAHG